MPPPPPLLPFPIPDSILLLIHLHLLQCPLELDPNMFNANIRGIGDRIKTMEHVVYFLMGKAEGKQHLEVLLPMYPSKKPADVLAFRCAVVKYLEGLRAAALKPPQAVKQQANGTKLPARSDRSNITGSAQGKSGVAKKPALPAKRLLPSARSVSATTSSRFGSSISTMASKQAFTSRSVSLGISEPSTLGSTSEASPVNHNAKPLATSKPEGHPAKIYGWWWKDVPIRRSLLEECTGPRFERLLLALSVHVLVLSSTPLSNDAIVGLHSASNLDMFAILSEQPDDYRGLVQRLNVLQLHLSEGKKDLVRQRRTVAFLQTLMVSSPAKGGDSQPSTQELGSQVSNLASQLDLSWISGANREETVDVFGSGEGGRRENNSVLQWLFAFAGASRHLERGGPLPTGHQTEKRNPTERKSTCKSVLGSRKTILPAPPLPTVAAHHASHLEALNIAKEKVANLRAIQTVDPEAPVLSDDTGIHKDMDGVRPREANAIAYGSLLGQETGFADSMKRFMQEMAELDDRLEKELRIKQELLLDVYKEEERAMNNQDLTNCPEELQHLEPRQRRFELNFETQSVATLPPILLRQVQDYSEVAISLQREIEDALSKVQANLAAEHQREWEEVDAEELAYESGDALESDDEDMANCTVLAPASGVLRSPTKSTRMSTPSHTPKRNLSLMQSKSTTKRSQHDPRLRSDTYQLLDKTPKHAQVASTPPAAQQFSAQNTPTNVRSSQSPHTRQSRAKAQTPSRTMATPSFFYSPGDGMEDLKEILPPFQSPWRSVARSRKSPRKSGKLSIHRPRTSKGRLASSSSFTRTPLKSGKRLSSIVPPISFPFAKLGQATPRASLDDMYEELVEDLVKSSNQKTPPLSMSARRLLDSRNNIQRSSPFKSLTGSGRAPRSPQSPDIGTEILEEESQEVDLSFGTARPLSSDHMYQWEDVFDGANDANTMANTKILNGAGPRFSEGPSFTLRDMLLKVGQDGMLGMNGTFNFDLLGEFGGNVGNDSMFDGI